MTSIIVPRVAIVTGAAQGIGYAIAHRLAKDGLDIALNDIPAKKDKLTEVAKEIQKSGSRAIAVLGDVSNEEDVRNLVEKTVEQLGSVDCMIANAGIVPFAPILESTAEDLDKCLATNVRGTMLLYKYAALQMVKQGRGGRLIAASSAAGKEALPSLSAYSASKFAIRGLTQAAAIELCPHNITANCYAPGQIYTGIELRANDKPVENGDKVMENNIFEVPAHVKGAKADVIASLVSFLCQPESYFITGQTISADGGWKLS